MKDKAPILLLLLAALWFWFGGAPETGNDISRSTLPGAASVQQAFAGNQSNIQVHGWGAVTRVLPPDNDGRPHQRFILELDDGHTVLIAHNLTLVDEVPNLQQDDQVEFFGEYEWNTRGGVVHWTHEDPAGRHVDGWLKYRGRRYQ